jgi:hypothetical protein
MGEPAIKAPRASYLPKIIEKYFRGAPIRDPAKNHKPICDQLSDWRRSNDGKKTVRGEITKRQNQRTNEEKPAPHPKALPL